MLIPWDENGRRTGPRGEKSCPDLNLGQIKNKNQYNLQVTNIPGYFRTTGYFCPAFCPQIRALGGEFVPVQKKFPQHVSQKLLILLTLLRFAAAVIPF